MAFPNLEPNHDTRNLTLGISVMCPFEVVDGQVVLHDHPVVQTSLWAHEADEAEVECPVCQVFKGKLHYVGSPDCAEVEDPDSTD